MPKLYIGGLGRPVAEVVDKVLRKNIQPHHILRSPPAIAFDDSLLTDADRYGYRTIEVFEIVSKTKYVTSKLTFEQYKIPVRRGHGDQSALPLAYWSVNGKDPTAFVAERLREAQDSQLGLL